MDALTLRIESWTGGYIATVHGPGLPVIGKALGAQIIDLRLARALKQLREWERAMGR